MPTHEELSDLLRKNMAEVLEVDPSEIKDDSDFADLDADSIDLIEVISQVERTYQIKIEEQRFYDLERFGQLVDLIEEEIARQS